LKKLFAIFEKLGGWELLNDLGDCMEALDLDEDLGRCATAGVLGC
jgi:hypothetical protein